MSELKAFRIIQGDTGGYGAPSYKCDADGNRTEEWSDACEVYDKSEADKVIARHKYKRCLAMAWWCELEIEQWIEYSDRWQRRKKWLKWWLELAEKFKDSEH